MTAGELRLLRILSLEHIADAVEQLHVALLGIRLNGGDKGPRHGSRGLGRDCRVGPERIVSIFFFLVPHTPKLKSLKGKDGNIRSLIVLATTPHDNIGRRCLCPLGALIGLIAAAKRCLGDGEQAAGHASNIATSIGANSRKQTLTSLLGKVGLLDDALGAVDIGQIKNGARVAAVKDGSQSHTGLEGLHDDIVNLIVDDMADGLEVNRVDDLIIAVVLIAVGIFSLPTMACRW